MSVLFAIIILLVELVPERIFNTNLALRSSSCSGWRWTCSSPASRPVLGAAHELALGPSNSQDLTSSRDSTLARSTMSEFTITQLFVVSLIAIQHVRMMARWWFLMSKSQLVRVMSLASELSCLPMYITPWSFSTGGKYWF